MPIFFFSSRRRHTRCSRDWSSDVCSSDLGAGGSSAVVVGGAVAVLLIGLWRARRPAIVRVVDVPIAGLPSDLEGFRIAQLSDLHVGPTLKRAFVGRVVDTTNGLQPDLTALSVDVAARVPP